MPNFFYHYYYFYLITVPDKEKRLKRISTQNEKDPTAFAVQTKLAEIFQWKHSYKVAVLVKHAEAVLYMKFYLNHNLPGIKVECVIGHHQGTYRFADLFIHKYLLVCCFLRQNEYVTYIKAIRVMVRKNGAKNRGNPRPSIRSDYYIPMQNPIRENRAST